MLVRYNFYLGHEHAGTREPNQTATTPSQQALRKNKSVSLLSDRFTKNIGFKFILFSRKQKMDEIQ